MTDRTPATGSPAGETAPRSRARHFHVSRRAFLAGSLAVVAGGAAAAVVGCDDRAPENDVAGWSAFPDARPPKTAAGSRGGIVRIFNDDAAPYDTLDPHLTQFGPIQNTHSAVFSRLLRYEDEASGEVIPDLADGMPEQPDGLTYIFRLRNGVRFHDSPGARAAYPAVAGRLLTGDDVRDSIQRQRDGSSAFSRRFFRRGDWESIDSIDVPDARTVIVRLRRPVAPMLSFFAGRHAFVVPGDALGPAGELQDPAALIGTGPFMLDSFEERVAVRLRRNPAWFASDDDPALGTDRPFLDGYDAFFLPQEDAFQRAALDRRTIDATGFVDQAELSRAHATNLSDIALEETPSGGILAMRLLLDRPPFADDRARRALHLAVDRVAMAELMYPAIDGVPSADLSGPVAPGARRWALPGEDFALRPGYRASTADRERDAAEARQLWTAAFGGDPVDLRVAFSGIPRTIPERAVEALRAQLQGSLGVNLIPQVDPSGGVILASGFLRNLEGATEGAVTCSFGLEDGGVDLDEWLYPHFRSGGAMNTYRLQDAQLDAILDAQRAELDDEARRKLGLDAQEYLIANVNARIEICAPVQRRLVWGYVRNSRAPFWRGTSQDLADVWLDTAHPSFAARPPEY